MGKVNAFAVATNVFFPITQTETAIYTTPTLTVGNEARIFMSGPAFDNITYIRQGDGLTGAVVGTMENGALTFAIDPAPTSRYTITNSGDFSEGGTTATLSLSIDMIRG